MSDTPETDADKAIYCVEKLASHAQQLNYNERPS